MYTNESYIKPHKQIEVYKMIEMQYQTATVYKKFKKYKTDICKLTLDAPEIAKTAMPGQFIMLYLDKADMFLPRPLSIADAHPQKGTIEIAFKAVGKGTKVLSEIKHKDSIKVLGPLGNGFLADERVKLSRVALVGGGIGVPPLYFLAKILKERGITVDYYSGSYDLPYMPNKFVGLVDKYYFAIENINTTWYVKRAFIGRVTDYLAKINERYDEIIACGPIPMLRAVAEYAKSKNMPCKISVEERMACGLGACVGCAVKTDEGYVRVCKEGPVFYSDEILCGGVKI
jgi:dihydroorotate dehydrogenase electron transfer subunit